MSRLICIDPGLDCTGVAVFAMNTVASQLVGEAMRHLREISKIETPSEMRLAPRLAALSGGLRALLTRQAAEIHGLHGLANEKLVVLVEEPAIAGVYGEREGRQRGGRALNAASMAKFFAAFGVVAATIAHYDHTLVKAGLSKETKRAVVEQSIERYPPTMTQVFPRTREGNRKQLSQDVVDAIALGLTWEGWRIR